MEVQVGKIEVTYSSRGIPSYSMAVRHDGLNKHRILRASDIYLIKLKAEHLINEWEERWNTISFRQSHHQNLEDKKLEASERTAEALAARELLSSLLKTSLNIRHTVNWENLKDKRQFSESKPIAAKTISAPIPRQKPSEPRKTEYRYHVTLKFFDYMIPSRKKRLIAEKETLFDKDYANWLAECQKIDRAHVEQCEAYEIQTRL